MLFGKLFASPQKVDVWMDSKVNMKHGQDLCAASMRGLVDGFIIGFVIGATLGIFQGWMNDAESKDFCLLSSSWALNGAAIGAIAFTLGNTILQTDLRPGSYIIR